MKLYTDESANNTFEKESLKQMGFILDGDGRVRTDG